MKDEPRLSIEFLANLAYQNGDKQWQRGWWDYVKAEAKHSGIEESDLIAEIKRLKSSNEPQRNGG